MAASRKTCRGVDSGRRQDNTVHSVRADGQKRHADRCVAPTPARPRLAGHSPSSPRPRFRAAGLKARLCCSMYVRRVALAEEMSSSSSRHLSPVCTLRCTIQRVARAGPAVPETTPELTLHSPCRPLCARWCATAADVNSVMQSDPKTRPYRI